MPEKLPIVFYYASHGGHTRRVVSYIADILKDRGLDVTAVDLGASKLRSEPPSKDVVNVVIAPIRYGYPLPSVEGFLKRHAAELDMNRLAVFLINLTARKEGKNTPEGNSYLRKWLKRRKIRPALTAAIAGELNYPAYNFFDRKMIQLIMTITKGPTGKTTHIEFTDKGQLEELAKGIGGWLVRNKLYTVPD